MTITHKINMDLVRNGVTPRIDAVQGDANSRVVEISLYAAGVAWAIPVDVSVSMRYRKSDGTKGIYDTLPDGTKAWSVNGNMISLTLAPQMLTAAGSVLAQIVMIRDEDLLATFALQINVAKDPSAGAVTSEDYICWNNEWLRNEIEDVFQTAKAAGELTGPQGEPGITPRFAAVTVETLEPGEDATASVSGETANLTLALGLPRGETGPQGERGPRGPGAPRNWLDNSYFRRPVNQSGLGNFSGAGPAIDRWTGYDGSSMDVNPGGVYQWTGTYAQVVEWDENLLAGPITIAVQFSGGDIVCATGTLSENAPVTAYFTGGIVELRIENGIKFLLNSTTSYYPVWAALYIGAYTIDILPEYQYKGYAAELAECQRYYANGLMLTDRTTGTNYRIYVDNGKLTMEVG